VIEWQMFPVSPRIRWAQMREVDCFMIEDYHVELIQMFENAGPGLELSVALIFV